MVWLVRVPTDPGQGLRWLHATAGNVGEGTLSSFAAALRESSLRGPVVLLLPASGALVSTVSSPVRNARQLQQALPFLVEENLAVDIDLMHVVPGPRMASGDLQFVAVARESVERLLNAFQAEGVDPDVLTVDALLLPIAADGALLFLDGADSLFVSSAGVALQLDESDAETILGALPGHSFGALDIRIGRERSVVAGRAVEASLAGGGVTVALHTEPVDLLTLLASGNVVGRLQRAPNLRAGPYAHQGGATLALDFDWRPLAWMAMAWVLVTVGYQFAVGIACGRAADAARAESVALYRQYFPGAAQVVDPRRQMQGLIASAASGDGGFVKQVAEVSAVMAELDGGGGRYVTRALGWEQAQGQLRMDIIARSLDDVEQLRQRLEARGLIVEVGAGVSQEGGYKARLNLGSGT